MAIFHNHPLLFEKTEWIPGANINSKFNTYGYGTIDKVIESTITETVEEFSLEMDVHSSCRVFNQLTKYNLILANGQVFRIIDTNFDSETQIKNVFARHISFDHNFDEIYDIKYNNNVVDCINNLHGRSQFNNFTIDINLGRYRLHKVEIELDAIGINEAIMSVINKLKEGAAELGDIIDVDIVRDNNKIGYYLNDKTNNTTIAGKNTGIRLDTTKISGIEIIEDDNDFCTKVIAKGKDDKVVKDITHPILGNAGLPFWITKVVSFPDDNVESTLKKKGQAHIITKSVNIKNIRVNIGDIAKTDFFKMITSHKDLALYDKVYVKHPLISDIYVEFRIVKIERDIHGELKGLEFGELTNDLIKTLKKAISKYS